VTARRWRTLLFALMGVAVLLALRPLTSEHSPEKWFRHSDKVGHLLLFAGLWVVALRAGFAAGWPLALILLAYGVADGRRGRRRRHCVGLGFHDPVSSPTRGRPRVGACR
jgi:hypothetical protein